MKTMAELKLVDISSLAGAALVEVALEKANLGYERNGLDIRVTFPEERRSTVLEVIRNTSRIAGYSCTVADESCGSDHGNAQAMIAGVWGEKEAIS